MYSCHKIASILLQEKYVLKSVARTRCGRVSRPPRHVIRDYKRLKHLTTRGSDAEDENENNGGYADYQALDESNKQTIINEKEKEVENLYGKEFLLHFI